MTIEQSIRVLESLKYVVISISAVLSLMLLKEISSLIVDLIDKAKELIYEKDKRNDLWFCRKLEQDKR